MNVHTINTAYTKVRFSIFVNAGFAKHSVVCPNSIRVVQVSLVALERSWVTWWLPWTSWVLPLQYTQIIISLVGWYHTNFWYVAHVNILGSASLCSQSTPSAGQGRYYSFSCCNTSAPLYSVLQKCGDIQKYVTANVQFAYVCPSVGWTKFSPLSWLHLGPPSSSPSPHSLSNR